MPNRIALLLENIYPAFDGIDRSLPAEELFDAAVEANVRWSMRQVLDTPEAPPAREGGRHEAGRHHLRSGNRPRPLSFPDP